MAKLKLYSLYITEWSFSSGGEHFNGSIKWGKNKEHRLKYKLSEKQASLLNKKDGSAFGSCFACLGKGDKSSRFFLKQDLIDCALKWCSKKYGILTTGDENNPGNILWSSEDSPVINRLKELGKQAEDWHDESDDPWRDFGDDVVDKVWDEWYSLIQQNFS